MTMFGPELKKGSLEMLILSLVETVPRHGYEIGKLVEARASLPRAVFAEAIARSGDEGFRAEPYLAELAVTDVGELGPLIDSILAANPGQVAAFRGGKDGLLGFFVGQVMKETGGKADPRAVNELLREKLAG